MFEEKREKRADDIGKEDSIEEMKWLKAFVTALALWLVGLALAFVLTIGRRNDGRTPRQDLVAEICTKLPASCADLQDAASPQFSALEWLTADPAFPSYSDARRLRRFTLATLRGSTSGWWESTGWMNHTAHECDWYGVTCKLGAVSAIQLSWNMAGGSLPRELALLGGNLEELDLGWNELNGTVPSELGMLTELKDLYLGSNILTSPLPTHLGKLDKLEALDLSWNEINGTVPSELGGLSKLVKLYLEKNSLTGPLPTHLGKLGNLEELYLHDNDLTGTMPTEVCDLRKNGSLKKVYVDSDKVACNCCG